MVPSAKQRHRSKPLRQLRTRSRSNRLPTQTSKAQQCPRLRFSQRAQQQSRHGSRRWPNSRLLRKRELEPRHKLKRRLTHRYKRNSATNRSCNLKLMPSNKLLPRPVLTLPKKSRPLSKQLLKQPSSPSKSPKRQSSSRKTAKAPRNNKHNRKL